MIKILNLRHFLYIMFLSIWNFGIWIVLLFILARAVTFVKSVGNQCQIRMSKFYSNGIAKYMVIMSFISVGFVRGTWSICIVMTDYEIVCDQVQYTFYILQFYIVFFHISWHLKSCLFLYSLQSKPLCIALCWQCYWFYIACCTCPHTIEKPFPTFQVGQIEVKILISKEHGVTVLTPLLWT